MGDAADRDMDKCFDVISALVDRAGAIIAKRNDARKEFLQKANDIDLVTETDQEVEKLLIDGLRKEFPSHKYDILELHIRKFGRLRIYFICYPLKAVKYWFTILERFIGEEESAEGRPNQLTNDPTWIIDPVDGTMNFVHAFPHSCVSVGLVVDKITELAIIYNPMLEQRFTARRGQGAFYNGRRIQVSGQKELSKALITSEFGTSRDNVKMLVVVENFAKIAGRAHGIRVLGSAALNMAMVALGGVDANYEFGVHAWDVCAGDLIVREAGGVVIDPAGGQFDMMSRRVLAASSMDLAQEIVKELTQFYPLPRDD